MFVQGIRSCHSFWKLQPSNPYQKLLHHAYPFIAASGQNQSHAEKQRVWSQSCGLQDMLYTILWLCSQLCYEIAANQRTLVQIELLATVGWTCGCQPFSCQCSQNVMHCRKVINATSLFKDSIPAYTFWESHAPPDLRLLLLQKKTCLMQRSRGSGRWVVVSKICYNSVIVLSVVLCDGCKPTKMCRDWAFSNSELEVGLPAFQLPMFAKCDALPKSD